MIRTTIHTVNRFFPFLFALLCVSIFAPFTAHAANLYSELPGGATDTMTFVNDGGTTYGGGNFQAILNDGTDMDSYLNGNTITGFALYMPGGAAARYASYLHANHGAAANFGIFECHRVGGLPISSGDCASGGGSYGNFYLFSGSAADAVYADGDWLVAPLPTPFTGRNGYSIVVSFFYNASNDGLTYSIGTGGTGCSMWNIRWGGTTYNGNCTPWGSNKIDVIIYGSTFTPPGPTCGAYSHICGFTPENGTTVTGPNVDFTLDYYVTQEDIDQNLNDVVVTLHNIDQNVLLLGFLSPGDIKLYDQVATSSGHVSFATTTALADGNYRLEAKMQRKFFFDWITIPGDAINQTISKQFIVGAPTFIGNLTQNGFNILNGTLASSTATSSIALVANCNPLGTFDMVNCLAGLFIPDAGQVQATIQGAQQGILTRMPWGYVTRFVGIVGGTGTTTLSTTYTTTVALNTASDTTELSFNPGDMFAGGATLVDSIESPYDSSVTFRSVFEPIIKLSIAVLVLLTIFSDITGSHAHHAEPGEVRRRRA